jgi:precorrin-8X/cobalt-precorrin-8 methylmutase
VTRFDDRIRQRCVIATGDPSVAGILKLLHSPVEAGLKALEAGAKIFVDIRMVEAGVVKKGHKSEVATFIGKGDDIASSKGITRTSAGVMALQEELTGSIVVIETPSSSHFMRPHRVGKAKPALVIGVPGLRECF